MGKTNGPGEEGPADIAAVLADEDLKLREIAKMYGNMSFVERIRKTLNGLSAPKDSGEYKFAKLQLQRSVGPIVAVLLPLGGVCFLLSLQKDVSVRERTQQVEIQEIEEAPDVEEPPEPPEDFEILDPVDVEIDGGKAVAHRWVYRQRIFTAFTRAARPWCCATRWVRIPA